MAYTISLEGNISIGKSTLIDIIKEHCDIETITEPYEVGDDLLEKYYNDPHTYAYEFQLRLLARRAHTHCEAQKVSNDRTIVLERTIQSDYHVFSQMAKELGYLTDSQYAGYMETYNDLAYFVKEPDLYIYMRAPLSLLISRIKTRNRQGEEKITIQYLDELQGLHDKWLGLTPKKNVAMLFINEFTDKRDMLEQFEDIMSEQREIMLSV